MSSYPYAARANTPRTPRATAVARPAAALALIAVFFLLLDSAASARHRYSPPPAPPPASSPDESAGTNSDVLSDWEAANRVNRHGWEPRPRNWSQNNRTPADWELRQFFATTKYWGSCGEWLKERITGNFTGTTDEIIQWGAYKWGIDPDIVRAVTVKESYWNQDGQGDWDQWGNSRSHGITQIRDENNPGTYPLSRQSTAFAVDYYGASLRFYYNGCADWLGWGYSAGDIWGAVGAWYTGGWWDSGAQWYVGEIQRVYWSRTWEGF